MILSLKTFSGLKIAVGTHMLTIDFYHLDLDRVNHHLTPSEWRALAKMAEWAADEQEKTKI